jgi:hypothetical protein
VIPKPKKQLSYKSAMRKADRAFSEYIRHRDTEILAGTRGGFCISCGQFKHYTELQCGHFINRKHLSLRFDNINGNAQCISCNCFDEGNNIGYTQGLIKKHSQQILDYLAAAKRNHIKYAVFELELIAENYKKKLKELK